MSAAQDREIIEMIRQIAGKHILHIFTGTVKSVDEDDRTMEVERDGVTYFNVRLQSVSGVNEGTVMIPKVGSYVSVGRIEALNNYVCIGFSKLDKIITNCDSVVFNGGENDGLVKVKELQNNLNELKEFVMAIHAALPTAFTAVGAAMAAAGSAGSTSYTGSMAGKNIVFADMENPKIKH